MEAFLIIFTIVVPAIVSLAFLWMLIAPLFGIKTGMESNGSFWGGHSSSHTETKNIQNNYYVDNRSIILEEEKNDARSYRTDTTNRLR